MWPSEVSQGKSRRAGRGEEVDTVAVLVEEAEGLLELCYLVVAELVRHGDEASRRRGKQKQGMLRARVNGYRACGGRVFVRERETGEGDDELRMLQAASWGLFGRRAQPNSRRLGIKTVGRGGSMSI